jgi:hypothetical protein
VRAEELDKQVDLIMKTLVIPDAWQIEVMNILTSLDERTRIAREKERIEEKLKRLRRLYAELEITEAEYEFEKRKLEVSLACMVIPQKDEMVRAGEKLKSMLAIWNEATEAEKAKMLSIMLDAIYCDTNKKAIVALKPKSPFVPIFSLFDSLREQGGLILVSNLVGIGDPEGDWDLNFITLENSSQLSLKNGSNSGCGLTATTSLSLIQTSWNRHRAILFLCSLLAWSQAMVTLARNSANFFRSSVETLNGISLVS